MKADIFQNDRLEEFRKLWYRLNEPEQRRILAIMNFLYFKEHKKFLKWAGEPLQYEIPMIILGFFEYLKFIFFVLPQHKI